MIIYLINLILILVFNIGINTYYINSECKCCCGNSKSGEISGGSKSNSDILPSGGWLEEGDKGVEEKKGEVPKKEENKEEPKAEEKKEEINKKIEEKKEEIKDDKEEGEKGTNKPIVIEFVDNNSINIDLKNLELFSPDIEEIIVNKQFTDRTTFCKLDEASYNLFTTDKEITLENTPNENTFVLFAVKTTSRKYYLGYCHNGSSVSVYYGLFNDVYTNVEIKILGSGNNLTNTNYMFYGCGNLEKIIFTIKGLHTSNVTSMKGMFANCKSLHNLNLYNFNTQNVTYMEGMFNGCKNLEELDLSNFNTINVTNMSCMFRDCKLLTKLNVSSFNTSNVTNMEDMFTNCNSLTSLNLSNFNTNNVTNMGSMFYKCESLTSLNLSSFNTSKVISMSNMFDGCKSLKKLDLSNFNTNNVTNMSGMFRECTNLKGNVTTNDKKIKKLL